MQVLGWLSRIRVKLGLGDIRKLQNSAHEARQYFEDANLCTWRSNSQWGKAMQIEAWLALVQSLPN